MYWDYHHSPFRALQNKVRLGLADLAVALANQEAREFTRRRHLVHCEGDRLGVDRACRRNWLAILSAVIDVKTHGLEDAPLGLFDRRVILAATIALEVGEIGRFLSAERLASYAGTTPRVHASGDRVRYGRTRPDVNRYLKWAFAEAGNSVAVNYRNWPERHVSQLYFRLRQRKGHNKAVGAVARHLAQARFYVQPTGSDQGCKRDVVMSHRLAE